MPSQPGTQVAARVRQVIADAGCSQREFARRIVMDPSKLSRSLGGSRRFTVAELARIADAGGVDAGWLLGTAPASGSAPGAGGAARSRTREVAGGRPLQIVRETVRLIAEAGDAAEELRQLIALQTPRTAQQRRQWLVWLDLWAEAGRSTAVGRLHAEFYRQWRKTVAEVLRRGVDQGVFRAVDPESGALSLTALIDGLAVQVLATAPGEGGTSAEDMYDACVAYVDAELAVKS